MHSEIVRQIDPVKNIRKENEIGHYKPEINQIELLPYFMVQKFQARF